MHTYYGHTILHRHSLSIQEDFFQIYVSLLWEVKDILGILKGTLNSGTKGEMFVYDYIILNCDPSAVVFYGKYFLKIISFLFCAEVSFAVGNILN